jgi:hypothetical protein
MTHQSFERIEHTGTAPATTLASNITSSATSIALASGGGTGWPTGSTGRFWVVIDRGQTAEEKILVETRTTDTLTLANANDRGEDGTSAAAHSAGAAVEHVATAVELDEANQLVDATLGTVTTKGDLLPATGAGALARLGAGANGTVLTAASGETTGLEWAAVPYPTTVPMALTWTFTDASSPAFTPEAGVAMPAAGSVVAVSLGLDEQLTQGTLTVEPVVQGSGTDLEAVVDSGGVGQATQYASNGQAGGLDTFAAGEIIAPSLTPSSALPSTADGVVVIFVTLDAAPT